MRVQWTLNVSTTEECLLLSDDLQLAANCAVSDPESVSISATQGGGSSLKLSGINGCGALDSDTTSLRVGKLSRKLIDL